MVFPLPWNPDMIEKFPTKYSANMIHLTNRNLQFRIGKQNFELLAVYNVSAISIMTFVKKPMKNIDRLLPIFITHPLFAEFTLFLA